jgi:hypothetical protein
MNIVVVADRSLGDRALVQWMTERDRSAVACFRVVVPVRVPGPWDLAEGTGGFVALACLAEDDYLADARARASAFIDDLRLLGLDVSGSVHAGETLQVLDLVLRGRHVDEFVVAPAANAMSRLFGLDLARRLRRRWQVPVCEVDTRARTLAA